MAVYGVPEVFEERGLFTRPAKAAAKAAATAEAATADGSAKPGQPG